MSALHESITRDCVFHTNKEGKYYFIVISEGKPIYESDTYEEQSECCQAGMDVLDFLHEKKPLQE